MKKYYYPAQRVAVVAMGCYMPDAANINVLWNNILAKKISIKEIPDKFFNKSVFYRPEVFGKANKKDKSYTKVGAIPDDLEFMALSRKYKIPPAVSAYMDINQKATIYCVDQVMNQLKNNLPKEKTAVILCSGAPGTKFENIVRRTFFSNVENHILNHSEVYGKLPQMEGVLKDVSDVILKETQLITEDSTTGYLQNITAGRIANIFDLWGPSYVVDAACASSLLAISEGVLGLLNYEYDAVITGGSEVTITEVGLAAFSGINALSPDGSYPFDSRANGFVMGLGGGIVVLKRLSDALRDGDYIHSIISGYCMGSDGKGKYIAAPSEEGQIRVITGACNMAGYSAGTIEMVEAHGTGTIVGDVVEVTSLKKAFEELGAKKENNCGLGSIKSNIGHLRNAAGIAGFIKASLAIENKILPATANVKQVNPKLQLESSPFYILTENKEWVENPLHPRRANISAFGFGGIDCHVCVEEFRPEFLQKSYTFCNRNKSKDKKGAEEAVFFSGDSLQEVCASIREFIANKSEESFEQVVYSNNLSACNNNEWRVSICASSMEQVRDKLQLIEEYIDKNKLEDSHLLGLKGIYIGNGTKTDSSQIAFMFPGQASQYPNMLKELYDNYSMVRSFYIKTDAMWKAKYDYSLMPLIFGEDEEQLKAELKNTRNTHPAMFVSNMAMYKLLEEAGIKADYMIGHSLGEITALYASGALSLKSAVNIIGERGFSFDRIDVDSRGKMISLKEKAKKVAKIIKDNDFKVSIANINSPEQTIVGGNNEQIAKIIEFLNKESYKYTELNVSHAFHTEVVSKAADEFSNRIKEINFSEPKCKVMACHRVDYYNSSKSSLEKMHDTLKEQMLSTVMFTDSVQKLYEEGVRVFIEAGPSNVLTNLVKTILSDKDVKIVNTNIKNKSSVDTFKQAMAILFAHGVEVNYVPSNKILGLYKENIDTVVYQVESKPVDTANSNKLTQNHDLTNSCPMNKVDMPFTQPDTFEEKTKESIVYSGVAVGLPGSFKKAFDDNNFEYITEGKNMIELLTDDEARSIYDLNITRLIKTEKETIFKRIESINEVIHFAGKFGKMDMINDYLIDETILAQMTQAICAGVAAGYEALKDAGIPLVREYRNTTSGPTLPGRFVLPKEMQDDTGIIYANGLWPIESVIVEVSKYTAAKFGSSTRREVLNFFESIISKVSDHDTKKLLADWFTMYYSRLSTYPGEADVYEFNHNFMSVLSSQANNRLAQFIGATGPNMYINTACSSNASSITVAEDMIRAGHARRMIVIGADISTTKDLLPWFGAGFSSIGALTECDNLFEAAVPFDNRRSGMILGSGATGIVIEREEDVLERGMNGICRLLGTHLFNCAGHQSKVDANKHCIELDRFITKMEKKHCLNRNNIASKLVYCSHETYSHKPGCSYMEKVSLERVFGEKYREIKVINTKGMTGHIMGASIDEAVSAKALQYQKIPPVVNTKEIDPELEGLNLSKGGEYEFDYVLRAVAAFGGQGNYHLMQRIAKGKERIVDNKAYREWIEKISSKDAELKNYGRILVAEDISSDNFPINAGYMEAAPVAEITRDEATSQFVRADDFKKASIEAPTTIDTQQIIDDILSIYSDVTRYPKDMLDLSMELEADLGVDTLKQATIFSKIAKNFNLNVIEIQGASNYNTIGQMIDFVVNKTNAAITDLEPQENKHSQNLVEVEKHKSTKVDCETEVLKLISEITLYPVELLDKDMEMEADLGIDTVKQATIFSMLIEKYGIDEDEAGSISQYRTIGELIELIKKYTDKIDFVQSQVTTTSIDNQINKIDFREDKTMVPHNLSIKDEVMKIISEITQYPVEMLEEDMEMEADLGVDTIKQATILSELSKKFCVGEDTNFIPSEFKTIKSLIETIKSIYDDETSVKSVDIVAKSDTEAKFKDTNSEQAENMSYRELSLQYPVVVEEKIGKKCFDLKDKNILVIGDNSETVRATAKYLGKISSNIFEIIFDKKENQLAIESKIINIIDTFKKIDAVLDLSHIGENIDFEGLSIENEEDILDKNSIDRFLFYKELSKNIDNPEMRIICTVSMDGCFGFNKQDTLKTDPFYGALCGFYKGLRKEFVKSKVKVLDLGNPKDIKLTSDLFSILKKEFEEGFDSYEIGYNNNKRITLKLANVDRSNLIPTLNFDYKHFVITGGGNGITAEIIREISRNTKAKFSIIGRTSIPSDIDELSRLELNELEQKKTEIYDQLKKEGKKATPSEVQKKFSYLTKAILVHKLLKEVRENGCEASYYSCDVSNFEDLKVAMDKAISNYGPANVVIHGAGIEKSRLLGQKTKAEFDEVFSVKAKGLCNLYRLLDKNELKLLIGFSSISGRFGNEAQLDYCAANNFISSFMSVVSSKNKGIRAISISWSGWKDLGIAWRNEFVKQNSEGMGLHLIEPERANAEFLNILFSKLSINEIVISKGLGPAFLKEKWHGIKHNVPMIDWLSEKDGKIKKVYKVFSVKADPIINHHRLGSTPLVPLVAYLEIGAQTHSLIYEKNKHYYFRDIKIYNPLKLFNEKAQEIVMTLEENSSSQSLEAIIYNYFKPKIGSGKMVDIASMKISGEIGDFESLMENLNIETEDMAEGLVSESLERLRKKHNSAIQLGPLFMDDKSAKINRYRYNHNGAVMIVSLSEEQIKNKKYDVQNLLFNPAFADTLMQTCGIHASGGDNNVFLPAEIGEFGVIKVPKEPGLFKSYAKQTKSSDSEKVYNVILLDDKGEICYYAKDVIVRRISQ